MSKSKTALVAIDLVSAIITVLMSGLIAHLLGATPEQLPLMINGAIIASTAHLCVGIVNAFFG